MLILHGRSHIFMPHGPHHRREIAGVAEDSGPVIVPGAIQDEILRELSLPACDSELLSCGHQQGDASPNYPGTCGKASAPFRSPFFSRWHPFDLRCVRIQGIHNGEASMGA